MIGITFAPVRVSASSASTAFENVQKEPHMANPIVLFSQSKFHTPNSFMMFMIVFLIMAPDVTGAILPGSDSAHITRTPYSFAASKSTPPDTKFG